MLASRGYDWSEDGSVLVKTTSPSKRLTGQDDNLFEDRRSGSVLSSTSFRRANLFAPAVQPHPQPKKQQPLRRLLSTRVVQFEGDDADTSEDMLIGVGAGEMDTDIGMGLEMEIDTPGAGPSRTSPTTTTNGKERAASPSALPPLSPKSTSAIIPPPLIFTDLRFALLGEADSPAVRKAIAGAGGRVIEAAEGVQRLEYMDVDIIIVRLVRYVSSYRLTIKRETK